MQASFGLDVDINSIEAMSTQQNINFDSAVMVHAFAPLAFLLFALEEPVHTEFIGKMSIASKR